jgi:rubrerythrin
MTTDFRALGMLKTALEMEDKGFRFYEKAVAESRNELGRGIFKMLQEDETVHVERIKKIYERLTGGLGWSDDWRDIPRAPRDLTQIFRDLAAKHGPNLKPHTGQLDALNVGLDFEMKSVEFYRSHLPQAENDLERLFLQEMIAEEELHYALLADMKLYLTDPESWFREKEKGGLDGT